MIRAPVIASIVEGFGEVAALPVLVGRIAWEMFGVPYVELPQPHRLARNKMTMSVELTRAARVQSARGGVLVLADADDDCAVDLAGTLVTCAGATPIEVVVAVREFEAWYLAGVASLRTHPAIRDDAVSPGQPERRRGA